MTTLTLLRRPRRTHLTVAAAADTTKTGQPAGQPAGQVRRAGDDLTALAAAVGVLTRTTR